MSLAICSVRLPFVGAAGGTITAQGTVRQLSRAKSPTAPFIKAELER